MSNFEVFFKKICNFETSVMVFSKIKTNNERAFRIGSSFHGVDELNIRVVEMTGGTQLGWFGWLVWLKLIV